MRGIVEKVSSHGGCGLPCVATPLALALPADIVGRFQAERTQDYTEFGERCRDFLGEIARETARRNLTFAELEENEQDAQQLGGWLEKIRARDFSPSAQTAEAERALAGCHAALAAFAQAVYVAAGLEPAATEPGDRSP